MGARGLRPTMRCENAFGAARETRPGRWLYDAQHCGGDGAGLKWVAPFSVAVTEKRTREEIDAYARALAAAVA